MPVRVDTHSDRWKARAQQVEVVLRRLGCRKAQPAAGGGYTAGYVLQGKYAVDVYFVPSSPANAGEAFVKKQFEDDAVPALRKAFGPVSDCRHPEYGKGVRIGFLARRC